MPEVKRQHANYLLQSPSGSGLALRDFDADVLKSESRWLGDVTGGRGQVGFARVAGHVVVIRQYRRGGLIARLSERHYLWSGLTGTRVYRELQLLEHLTALGLPVPVPVGGVVRRKGLCYEAALMTVKIDGAMTLAERIAASPLAASGWSEVGALIRRFHDAGLWHADLNANNILFDGESGLHLIDFDRGRLRPHQDRWKQSNLARLERSLIKIASRDPGLCFSQADFRQLCRGYAA